jgi:2-dehydro-3-deoxygluconokinase
MKKILCFGELLLRISPPAASNWLSQHQLQVYLGGAELNVAHALAHWQVPVSYCTALPNNFIAYDIINQLKHAQIDTAAIQRGGNRIGLYFLQQGTDVKNKQVYFDRKASAFAELQPGTINWENVLANVKWLHFSAIVPALNDTLVQVCEEMLEAVSKKNITISLDLNYRASLWSPNRKPDTILPSLAKYCHVIMGNIWSANLLLGAPLHLSNDGKISKDAYLHQAESTVSYIINQFPKCHTVANTFRFDMPDGSLQYFASLFHEGQFWVSPEMQSNNVKDKVGSGDCFMAALIYGIEQNMQTQQIINFAAAAAFGKLHEFGDVTQQTIPDILKIMQQYA